jgi:hypothetical protein
LWPFFVVAQAGNGSAGSGVSQKMVTTDAFDGKD